MLWIALYLPELALQIVERRSEFVATRPVIISEGAGHRSAVYAANRAARHGGITSGMRVTAAQALIGDVLLILRNPAAEAAALRRLATWAGQFTPAVAIETLQGLVLEVSGSLSLFNGLENLLDLILHGLRDMGYRCIPGAAPTARAASLLAKNGAIRNNMRSCTQFAGLSACLDALPLSLFDWEPATQAVLQDLAVDTIGRFRALPRAGVLKRFGPEPVRQIEQALGLIPDPRAYHTPPASFSTRIEFLYEVTQAEALLFSIKRQLLELEGFLRARGAGVQQFVLHLQHAGRDSRPTRIAVGLLSPERETARLLALARERLECQLPDTPVSAVTLTADTPLPYAAVNHSWLPDARNQTLDWRELRERLLARLGQEQLFVLEAGNDHRPEFATTQPGAQRTRAMPALPAPQTRPLWLLPQPARLAMTAQSPNYHGPLTLRAGPERMETGWWDDNAVKRDYYVACNAAGETVWIYQDHQQQQNWFLHGLFA